MRGPGIAYQNPLDHRVPHSPEHLQRHVDIDRKEQQAEARKMQRAQDRCDADSWGFKIFPQPAAAASLQKMSLPEFGHRHANSLKQSVENEIRLRAMPDSSDEENATK